MEENTPKQGVMAILERDFSEILEVCRILKAEGGDPRICYLQIGDKLVRDDHGLGLNA